MSNEQPYDKPFYITSSILICKKDFIAEYKDEIQIIKEGTHWWVAEVNKEKNYAVLLSVHDMLKKFSLTIFLSTADEYFTTDPDKISLKS